MLCDFTYAAGCGTCRRCGFHLCGVAPPVHRKCGVQPMRSPGLGDFVAGCLSAVGITKERVSRWLGYDCGCAKRQARWNELGWHLVAIVRRRIGIS